MRKKLTTIPIVLSLFTVLSVPAYAEKTDLSSNTNPQMLKGKTINYQSGLGHNNKTKSQLVDGMLSDGLTQEDAEYYANLDILFATLERDNVKINFDEVQSYPEEYTATHLIEIKDRAINLDQRALKTLIQGSSSMSYGSKDLEEMTKDKSLDSMNKITIKYSDGSTLTKEAGTVRNEPIDEYTTDTAIPGPWSTSSGGDDMFWQEPLNASGSYTAYTTVTYSGLTYWAKANDTLSFQILNNGSTDQTKWSAKFISDSGSSSGSGSITNVEYLSNQAGPTIATGNNSFIQGYTDIKFTLSATVGGSVNFFDGVAGLNFSVTAGSFWHEYAITEVSGSAQVLHWSAYFK